MPERDIILTINVVEPDLVRAVNLHAQNEGRQLKGLVLVDTAFADAPDRLRDTTGLFKEIICDCSDPNEIQTILKPYTDRLLAVTYRYENSFEALRRVLPFLPYIQHPSESSLLWCTDKRLMRDRLSNYDSSLTPKYQYLESGDMQNLDALTRGFTFPVIVKPSGLVGSLLVEQCKDAPELHNRLTHTFEIIQDVYDKEYRLNKPGVLVEEMMQGDMYSIDAYVTHDGRIFCLPLVQVITSYSMGLPGFYGYQRITPTSLSEDESRRAFAAASAAIRALSLSSSSAHIELFRTKDGWKIIELGPRIGGYRDIMYRQAYGVEHFYNDIAIRMGQEPQMPNQPIAHASTITLYADKEGVIKSVEGLELAKKLVSTVYLEDHSVTGEKAYLPGNGGHSLVDIILSNENPNQLEADIAKVRELIKINVS